MIYFQINFPLKHFSQHSKLLQFCKQDFISHNKLKTNEETFPNDDLTDLVPSTPVECPKNPLNKPSTGEGHSHPELQFYNHHFENKTEVEISLVARENVKIENILCDDVSFVNNLICTNNCQKDIKEIEEVYHRLISYIY